MSAGAEPRRARAVPVGEAMLAIVLADHLLRQRALVGGLGS
jgi:chorismate synthase